MCIENRQTREEVEDFRDWVFYLLVPGARPWKVGPSKHDCLLVCLGRTTLAAAAALHGASFWFVSVHVKCDFNR